MNESEQPKKPGEVGRLDLPITIGVSNASISRLASIFRQRKALPPDPPQQAEWQPIETAEQDKRVLVVNARGFVSVAYGNGIAYDAG